MVNQPGKGHGLTLVKALEEHAKKEGFTELAFSTPGRSMAKVLIKRIKEGQHYHFRMEWSDTIKEDFIVLYTILDSPKIKENTKNDTKQT